MRASEFLKQRNSLLEVLVQIDSEIDKVLAFPKSQKAVAAARKLFTQRQIVADALEDFGLSTESHPAVWRRG